VARWAARALRAGDLQRGLSLVFERADHLLFKLLAVVPALLEPSLPLPPGWLAGMFFAAASVWMLWLVGRVALQAGAGPGRRRIRTRIGRRNELALLLLSALFPLRSVAGFFSHLFTLRFRKIDPNERLRSCGRVRGIGLSFLQRLLDGRCDHARAPRPLRREQAGATDCGGQVGRSSG